MGEKFVSHEVVVEQDDTLHEKRFVFEYLHLENTGRFQFEEKKIQEKKKEYLAMCFRHKEIWDCKFQVGEEIYLNNLNYQCVRKFYSVFFKN